MAAKKYDERDYSTGSDAFLMSDEDYSLAKQYGDQWNEAYKNGNQAGMDAAHAAVEGIRSKYNYSGGSDGSQYIQTGNQYGSAPSYTSKYQDQIDQVLAGIMNRPAFSYDYTQDPLYQQYKEAYTREGQRAMQDTLGQVSARTGGLASSYATAAAQGANDYYMQQLSDKIPELQQLAYSMYMDDLNADIQRLGLLQGLESDNYGMYQDTLGQWNTDRSFQYGLDRDKVNDNRYQTEWDYGVSRDQLEDQRYDQQWQHQLDREAIEDARYEREWAYQVQQDALNRAARRSSGSSSGNSSGGGDVYQQLMESGATDYGTAYQMLRAAGYGTTDANRYATYFADTYYPNNSGGGSPSLDDIDQESILSLGLGPISYSAVEDLAEEGKVTVTQLSGGRVKVQWAPGWNKDNYRNKNQTTSGGIPVFSPNFSKWMN